MPSGDDKVDALRRLVLGTPSHERADESARPGAVEPERIAIAAATVGDRQVAGGVRGGIVGRGLPLTSY